MIVPVLVPGCAVCVRLGAGLVQARLGGGDVLAAEVAVRHHQRYAHGVGARGEERAP